MPKTISNEDYDKAIEKLQSETFAVNLTDSQKLVYVIEANKVQEFLDLIK